MSSKPLDVDIAYLLGTAPTDTPIAKKPAPQDDFSWLFSPPVHCDQPLSSTYCTTTQDTKNQELPPADDNYEWASFDTPSSESQPPSQPKMSTARVTKEDPDFEWLEKLWASFDTPSSESQPPSQPKMSTARVTKEDPDFE